MHWTSYLRWRCWTWCRSQHPGLQGCVTRWGWCHHRSRTSGWYRTRQGWTGSRSDPPTPWTPGEKTYILLIKSLMITSVEDYIFVTHITAPVSKVKLRIRHFICFAATVIFIPASQRTHDAMITSLLRQNDVATSFWRNNDVIIAPGALWYTSLSLVRRRTKKGKWRVADLPTFIEISLFDGYGAIVIG